MQGSQPNPLILFVDDDPIIQENVVELLELAGYRTLVANDGVEALVLMDTHLPDLIISDITMPNMDGFAFYEAVRAKTAWLIIPFIFLSARGEQEDIRCGYRMGVDFYLSKPFEPQDLLIAIDSRLKRITEIQSAIRDEVERNIKHLSDSIDHAPPKSAFKIKVTNEEQPSPTRSARVTRSCKIFQALHIRLEMFASKLKNRSQ